MPTLLDHPEAPSVMPTDAPSTPPAERLRTTMAACRVRFAWFGTSKALTASQRARAAEALDADAPYLSAAKKLLDTAHPAFRAVTAVRTRIVEAWRSATLPFPEPGTRLIPLDRLDDFDHRMRDYRVELDEAVAGLDRHYAELVSAARERLGSLFHEGDYPESLVGLFEVAWDFPAIEPPEYLVRLSPRLYEAEQARVRARFEEAVALAERAFADEFAALVEHLCVRLTGTDADGTPKVFRDSAVGNLTEFFDRFRELNVRSNPELDALVERARRVVRGVRPQHLRDGVSLRAAVATQLGSVRDELDGLLVDRPRRRILRHASTTGAA